MCPRLIVSRAGARSYIRHDVVRDVCGSEQRFPREVLTREILKLYTNNIGKRFTPLIMVCYYFTRAVLFAYIPDKQIPYTIYQYDVIS